jgi:predicted O-methyltransferase YrrM
MGATGPGTALLELLERLYADGVDHDAAEPDRLRKRRNLEPASARLLWALVGMTHARDVVEIGTSNAYSTIWLADALGATGGHVVSVDVARDPDAEANLAAATTSAGDAGMAARVKLRLSDGGTYLATLPDASVDLLFLDAERVEYPGWWPHPVRVLRRPGVLAVDNVLSHPGEVDSFLALVDGEPEMSGVTVDVGKGLFLAWRA